jgi:short-subunit dehydrogenase
MKIEGSYFLITGSNRGIGRAVANEVAGRKAHLMLANRTSDASLKEELMARGAASVQDLHVDLGDRKSIDALISQLKTKRVDILFNNAGQLTGGLFEEQSLDDIYSMLQVNVNALIHLTHGLLPQMIKQKSGKIINHSSVSGIMNIPCASTYSAAKSAVLAFNNCIRQELKPTGVTTLALITPGIETRMFNDIPKMYGKNLNVGSFLKSITPEDYAVQIANAVESDQDYLLPSGSTRLSLFLAQHSPGLFEFIMGKNFTR